MVGVGGEVEVERDGVECEESEHDFQRLAVHVFMRSLSLSTLSLSSDSFSFSSSLVWVFIN